VSDEERREHEEADLGEDAAPSEQPVEEGSPQEQDQTEDSTSEPSDEDEGIIPFEERDERDYRKAPALAEDSSWRDACPNCGADLPSPEAVLCMRCGYDMLANEVRATRIGGPSEAEEDEDEGEPGDFFRPGRLGWRVPLGASVALIVVAAVLAGMNADARQFVHGLVTFFYAPVHAAVGLGAAALTARLLEDRLGRLELGAVRMLLATSLFLACFHAGQALAAHPFLQFLAGAGVGAGLYFLWVWWSLGVTRVVAFMVAGFHFVFWLLLSGLLWLQRLAASPVVEEATNGAGPGTIG